MKKVGLNKVVTKTEAIHVYTHVSTFPHFVRSFIEHNK
jgi:hypothetical protein